MADVNIEQLKKYFFKGLPIEYLTKYGSVNIYPILVDEWDIFENNYDILLQEKNKIPIPEIIQMSYLQFLIEVLFIEEKYQNKFRKIMSLCLHEKNLNIRYIDNKYYVVITDDDKNIKTMINYKDFDNIKKIILYKNIDGYDDEEISDDVKKVMEDYLKLTNGNYEPVTLEDKLIFLGNETGLKLNDMLQMTYREFTKRFDMAVSRMDYTINRTAELSGNVKFEQPIEHILYKKKKNKFEKFFVKKDEISNKIQSVNG